MELSPDINGSHYIQQIDAEMFLVFNQQVQLEFC